ncbi:MAG: hypothetical protein CMJ78_10425 [Planctomycetaceae bacterium]|nr:hypothetical protein [Planctomycetaceae bacterium]
MALIDLTCKKCKGELSLEDTDQEMHILRCRHCHAVFALRKKGEPPSEPAREKRFVEMPARCNIERGNDHLKITWRWFTVAVWFLIFFAVMWNGFMVFWHSMTISKGLWFMSAFGLIHTAVGVGLVYYIFALFINHTEITVSDGSIRVSHGPLPWGGNKTVSADSVSQLFCYERIRRTKNGGRNYSYEVKIARDRGRNQTLVAGLHDVEQAMFIEQEIEEFLGIEDRPIRGEYEL